MNIEERSICRICNGKLESVLDLGFLYPSNFVQDQENLERAPLVLSKCDECNLVQLKHTVELDSMYRQYWYRSSLNPSMIKDLQDVVSNIEQIIKLEDGDVVVDIGANDGTMLSLYKNKNLVTIGIDPALNLKERATNNCKFFINDYFSAAQLKAFPKAKVITSIAMFYDLENPHTFVEDIKNTLAEDGIWVVQFTDLLSMFKANAFDNICHEHLEYYSLEDLVKLLAEHQLSVFDVSYNKVNGGSLRIYVCHQNTRSLNLSVLNFLAEENEYFNSSGGTLEAFKERVQHIKYTIFEYIKQLRIDGNMVALMGASTKGNTLLQYFGLDSYYIDHAAEVNEDKFGLKTVGTNIRIISQKDSMFLAPDYYFIPIWHFASNLIERNWPYLERGGKFLIPMPKPVVVSMNAKGEIEWQELKLNQLDS